MKMSFDIKFLGSWTCDFNGSLPSPFGHRNVKIALGCLLLERDQIQMLLHQVI